MENNRNVLIVCVRVGGGEAMKCGGGVGWKTVEMWCWRRKAIEMWKWWWRSLKGIEMWWRSS